MCFGVTARPELRTFGLRVTVDNLLKVDPWPAIIEEMAMKGREKSPWRGLAPALGVLMLAGCAIAPGPTGEAPDAGAPSEPSPSQPASSDQRHAAVVALADRAEAAFQAGRYAEAAAVLERALAIDGRDAEAWLALGWVRLAQGDAAQARVLASRARGLQGGDELACRAEHLAGADASGRAAVAARDRAQRACGPGRG